MEAGKCEKVGKMCKKTCDMCEEEPKKSNYFRFSLTCNISSFLKKIINILSNQKFIIYGYKPGSPDIYPVLRLSLIMRKYEKVWTYFHFDHKNLTIIIQGVLALCEFHYCEFCYCGFSKPLLKICLMRFLCTINFVNAVIFLMRFLANATFLQVPKVA